MFSSISAGKMQICSVCSEQTPKYRCPTCNIRYCSLGCYKKHKDSCLPVEKPASSNPESIDATGSEPLSLDDLLHEDDVIDKVPPQRLQLLGQSPELRDLLSNPHLRQLLRSIDDAESKASAMKAAMQEPLFVEFADQCLKVVEGEGNALFSND
ncbi:zinc finger HIT domain-containing protein 3 isoform X2 [Gambusia affinis]|uniref:zinc finger HIT domain-containing protein 3 isoform X2 n=1 Tax=Gambusia affinis TaxID=33528 RepID=UPI001CDC2507|nr:zinc finger HIT domain-containing protein 3 isoform X2 [Gambusia affinis]